MTAGSADAEPGHRPPTGRDMPGVAHEGMHNTRAPKRAEPLRENPTFDQQERSRHGPARAARACATGR
jgi:hypothetical protein